MLFRTLRIIEQLHHADRYDEMTARPRATFAADQGIFASPADKSQKE